MRERGHEATEALPSDELLRRYLSLNAQNFEISVQCFPCRQQNLRRKQAARHTHGRFVVEDLSVPQDEPATFPSFHLTAHLQQIARLLQHLLQT